MEGDDEDDVEDSQAKGCDRCGYTGLMECKSCNDSGVFNKDGEVEKCQECDGRGWVCCYCCTPSKF